MTPYVQQYLITGDGIEPFTTEYYDYGNNYIEDINMKVYDLHGQVYTDNGIDWKPFETDHL